LIYAPGYGDRSFKMKSLSVFDISFTGLSNGVHRFDYELGEAFFTEFGDEKFNSAAVKVNIDLDKSDGILTLLFRIDGEITTLCDRCLEEVTLPVKDTKVMLVAFEGNEKRPKEVDDIVVLDHKAHVLNVAQHMYDYVSLSLPMRRVHNEGECDEEAIKVLESKLGKPEIATDPRWEKLKNIADPEQE
jgi:uncharacterized metal-binding protein YceD (DUF177 family)